MEKKQLISVVKPLIAAALLFGSSGGVAWGQLAPNANHCSGPIQAQSYSWSGVDNNYGPGEGYYPNAPIQLSSGSTIGFGTVGKITVGGTSNIVVLESPATLVATTPVPDVHCGTHPHDYYTDSHPGASITAPAAPGVPDGTGVTLPTAAYSRETYVQVTGTSAWNAPWSLDHLFFTNNSWNKLVYAGHTGTTCWTQNGCGTGSRPFIYFTRSASTHGGYTTGRIQMMGGHIRLTGNGSASSANSKKAVLAQMFLLVDRMLTLSYRTLNTH